MDIGILIPRRTEYSLLLYLNKFYVTDFIIIIIKKQREIGTLKMVKKKKPSKFLSILEEEEF